MHVATFQCLHGVVQYMRMKALLVFGLLLVPLTLCPTSSQDRASLELRVFPEDARIFIDEVSRPVLAEEGFFRLYGSVELPFSLHIRKEGYEPYFVRIEDFNGPASPEKTHLLRYDEQQGILRIEAKLERLNSSPFLLASLPSGLKPKSVIFAPDGQSFFAAQLNGYGIDAYENPGFSRRNIRLTSDYSNARGYVEFAVLKKRNQLWVSQMENGRIHVLNLDNLEKIAEFPSEGNWTKVICFDREENLAFVSNWLSGDVTVFSTEDFSFLGSFDTGGVPRGMAVSPNNRQLFVADYENGRLLSFDISFLTAMPLNTGQGMESLRWSRVLDGGPGAKRHIVIADSLNRMFVSDMYHGSIFVYDLPSGKRTAVIPVGQKLNTIALDPDEKFLYISSRGKNNPESYLIPGPDFGKIHVMNTRSLEVVDWIWGRNQPTGLAVSPEGNLLVFSDFLDSQLEVYDISARSAVHPLVRALGLSALKVREFLHRSDELPSPVKLVQE